jgi:hypothetical protein
MYNEFINPKGTLSIVLTGPDGQVIDERHEENLVVNTGLAYISSRMKDTAAAVMSHMAVGTSATAAAAAQTALVAENGRVALTSTTIVTTTAANDAIQYVATFPPGTGTGALTEAGILNAASVGTLLSRTVFSVINKGALDSLTITWKITAQ